MKHCMDGEYSDKEQYLTCIKCAHPLADNQLVKDAYKLNSTAVWAKGQLRILADMARGRGFYWFADGVDKIMNDIRLMPQEEGDVSDQRH